MKVHAANVRSHAVRHPKSRLEPKKREYLYGQGPAKAMRILLERTAKRLAKQVTRGKAYGLPERLFIVANMENAVTSLREAVKGLDEVPDDWKPERGSLR